MAVKDNIWNLQFGKRIKPESIPAEAFSSDGYIINQGLITDVRYGRKTTKEIGCGWIAVYNFLHYMGETPDPLDIAHEMERMLLWGGFIGNHPTVPFIYLWRKGYRCRIAFFRKGIERILRKHAGRSEAETAKGNERKRENTGKTKKMGLGTSVKNPGASGKIGGIITYIHSNGSHFATFIKDDDADVLRRNRSKANEASASDCSYEKMKFRFLNVNYGSPHTVWSFEEFFRFKVSKKRYKKICFAIIWISE